VAYRYVIFTSINNTGIAVALSPEKGGKDMRILSLITGIALAVAVAALLASCSMMPTDWELDADWSDSWILPDGNPTFPDNTSTCDNVINAAASDGNRVVAVGTKIIVLNNDSTWSTVFSNPGMCFRDIIWADTAFIAISNKSALAYSRDGLTWEILDAPSSFTSFAYSGSRLVGVENFSSSLYYIMEYKIFIYVMSELGTMDEIEPPDSISHLQKILWTGSQFIAFGYLMSANSVKSSVVITSPDGYTWTRHPIESQPVLEDVIWCCDHFLASRGYNIYRSENGMEWTEIATLTGPIERLYRYGSNYLAVGPAHVSMSSDGTNWREARLPARKNLHDAIFFDGRYYVFGTEAIFSSIDGIYWKACTLE
jgi:hypothetical protein